MTSFTSALRNTQGWIGLTLAAVVGVAGATVGAQASSSGPTPSPAGSTVPAGSSSANDPHQAEAARQVVQMLAAFQPPPGAKAVQQPDPLPSSLAKPPMWSSAATQEAAVRWYETSESPGRVLAWVQAHPPTGSEPAVSASESAGPSLLSFAFPGPQSWLIVTPENASDGRTIIRLDASAVWIPSRPAGSQLGYGSTSVSVVTTNRLNPQFPVPADESTPHTSTDPAVVHQAVDLLNALQPPIPGTKHCADDLGITVQITLPDLATVKADAGGCGAVAITPQGGSPQYYSGASDLIPKVYALFGVTWSRTTGLPPGTGRTGASGTR